MFFALTRHPDINRLPTVVSVRVFCVFLSVCVCLWFMREFCVCECVTRTLHEYFSAEIPMKKNDCFFHGNFPTILKILKQCPSTLLFSVVLKKRLCLLTILINAHNDVIRMLILSSSCPIRVLSYFVQENLILVIHQNQRCSFWDLSMTRQ